MSALTRFSPATQAWFAGAFAAPTAAQAGAWDAIASGQHALVTAPSRVEQVTRERAPDQAHG